MTRANDRVAALLEEYADLLTITGGDAFRARVYEKASRAVAGHHHDVARLDAKALQKIHGVGASIAEKIVEYLATGRIAAVQRLRAKIPSLRRMRETIGDIDIPAAAADSAPLMEAFTRLPQVAEVIVRGDKNPSVRTTCPTS